MKMKLSLKLEKTNPVTVQAPGNRRLSRYLCFHKTYHLDTQTEKTSVTFGLSWLELEHALYLKNCLEP